MSQVCDSADGLAPMLHHRASFAGLVDQVERGFRGAFEFAEARLKNDFCVPGLAGVKQTSRMAKRTNPNNQKLFEAGNEVIIDAPDGFRRATAVWGVYSASA